VKKLYNFSTKGFKTVYDITKERFLNIPLNKYNKKIHKTAHDKKFICYSEDNRVLFEYWGSKQDFLKQYNFPSRVWGIIKNEEVFYSKNKKCKEYDKCYFKLIDWKK